MTPATRAALAGSLAMATAMGIGRFVYTPILPHMIEGGALTVPQAGLVAGANFTGYLLGALATASGVFAPRRRMWFWLGLCASVATTGAMALEGGLAWMAAVRFASGVASAFAMVFISTLVMAKLAEEGRPGFIAAHFGGVGFGIACSAALVALVSASGAPWPHLWTGSAIAGAAAIAAVAFLLPPTRREVRPPAFSAAERAAAVPWKMVASYGVFGFGYVITATFINTMARSDPRLADVEPYVWLVVGLVAIPSVWFWNRIAARRGVVFAYAVACLIEAAAVAAAALLPGIATLLCAALALGGTFIAVTALGLQRARDLAPSNPARAIAVMTVSFGLGQVVGPPVAGWLYDAFASLRPGSLAASAALLLAALLVLAMREGEGGRTGRAGADKGAGIAS
jgi:predicted MFS family arabinose efflux permease